NTITYTLSLHDALPIYDQGQVTTWILRLVEISPYPQSFASFAAWYYTLDGTPIETDIVKHVTLDIGGGQFHSCEVDILHQVAGRDRKSTRLNSSHGSIS